jgi:hypothetical protein
VIRAAGGGDGVPKPSKTSADMPLLRSFLASTSGGGQVRQDFYDKWSKISSQKASADFNDEKFNAPDYVPMKNAYNAIIKLNKQYKSIQQDPNMNSSEKRRRLDELDGRMNDISAKALGRR